MSVLKLHLLVKHQQKVSELLIFICSCPTIIILKNTLKVVDRKCGYSRFDHRYNVSPIHLGSLFGVRNYTKVARVWADRLGSGPRLPKV
jgi:hypothetical protein